MEPTAWCASGTLEHAALLTRIHRDYINAGAEVITTNTFATGRHILKAAGIGEKFGEVNRIAVESALAAAEGTGAVVAGSISNMTPRRDLHGEADLSELADAQMELAQFLVDAGCELILLEMMFSPERLPGAFAAATATGLPVWAGFSARRGEDGAVVSFAQDREIPFAEVTPILADFEVAAAGVMHSESEVTGDAVALVAEAFDGPLTAYPDSGHMKMPDWQFEEIISVEDYTAFAHGWRKQGVQVIGGCCGLGLDHIQALRALR
jgi:homocysteine S-methyltransferase